MPGIKTINVEPTIEFLIQQLSFFGIEDKIYQTAIINTVRSITKTAIKQAFEETRENMIAKPETPLFDYETEYYKGWNDCVKQLKEKQDNYLKQ